MIVIKEQTSADRKPFDCVAFVCDSRQAARNLTYALATAFQVIISIVINTIFTYINDTCVIEKKLFDCKYNLILDFEKRFYRLQRFYIFCYRGYFCFFINTKEN